MRQSRPAGGASADGAATGRAVQNTACIADTQTASPWCESARGASDVRDEQTTAGTRCRHEAAACLSWAEGMAPLWVVTVTVTATATATGAEIGFGIGIASARGSSLASPSGPRL